MKSSTLCLFALLACIQVAVLVAFYPYFHQYSSYKDKTFVRHLTRKTHSGQKSNFTSSLQTNKSVDVLQNSTRYSSFKDIRTQCSQLTFSFVSHITQPHFDERNTELFLLVLITSGVGTSYATRRNFIRDTWGNEANPPASKNWKRIFVLGMTKAIEIQQEAAVFNDILVLNMTDSYKNLVIKVLSGLAWSISNLNPRFILKADDDVYVRVPYLISWLEKYGSDQFYGGTVIPHEKRRSNRSKNRVLKDCFAEDFYPPYCAGSFYVVSSNILPSLFESVRKWTAIPVEDAYLGILARENGIKPVSITGFKRKKKLIEKYGACNWASAIALGHGLDLLQLGYVEKKLRETSRLASDYYKC